MKISDKMLITDIMKNHKAASAVFKRYNLRCLSCKGAEQDTVEKVALNNGLDIAAFVNELNEADQAGK